MDLDLTWEQKGLIGVGVVVLVILIYAYGPFTPSTDVIENNNTTTIVAEPQLLPINTPANENSSNNNGSVSLNITSQKAKEIASLPGYRTGNPSTGSIIINNETVFVWIVPLYQNNILAKDVYVDKSSGNIVATNDRNNSTTD
jgi:hypothetical protein